jgi:hypothetical protein
LLPVGLTASVILSTFCISSLEAMPLSILNPRFAKALPTALVSPFSIKDVEGVPGRTGFRVISVPIRTGFYTNKTAVFVKPYDLGNDPAVRVFLIELCYACVNRNVFAQVKVCHF